LALLAATVRTALEGAEDSAVPPSLAVRTGRSMDVLHLEDPDNYQLQPRESGLPVARLALLEAPDECEDSIPTHRATEGVRRVEGIYHFCGRPEAVGCVAEKVVDEDRSQVGAFLSVLSSSGYDDLLSPFNP